MPSARTLPRAHATHTQVLRQQLAGSSGLFCNIPSATTFTLFNSNPYTQSYYRGSLSNNVAEFLPLLLLSGVGNADNIQYQLGVTPPGQPQSIFDIMNTIGEPLLATSRGGPDMSIMRCACHAARGGTQVGRVSLSNSSPADACSLRYGTLASRLTTPAGCRGERQD
jgi:hypothetical protein